MSANTYKRLSVSDTFVVPYTANKSWDIESASFADNRIVVNIGVNYSGSPFDPTTENFTNNQYDRLVYDTINMIYYPSFLSRYIDTSSKASTIYNDGTLTTSSYYRGHVELGNIDTIKRFPTGSNAVIYVINVPRNLTSEKILPTTFELYFSGSNTFKIYDDGNYNLFYSGSNVNSSIGTVLSQSSYVGNVFYEQNIAIITAIPNSIRQTAWRGANPYCVESTPSVTPSVTPSTTPSISVTPSISISATPSKTPSVTPTISVTPSVTSTIPLTPSITPSVTPTITNTPSITPTITHTPSITPSITPTASTYTCTSYQITNNGGSSILWTGISCNSGLSVGGTVTGGSSTSTGCLRDGSFAYGDNGSIIISSDIC